MAAEPLTQAATARHRRAVERAERALRELDAEGALISFQAVARRAGVSRQWLYTQPVLRKEIKQLRDRTPARPDGVPTRQRATEASLRQRLETLRAETSACGRKTPASRPSSRSPTASSAPSADLGHPAPSPRSAPAAAAADLLTRSVQFGLHASPGCPCCRG